MVFSKLSDPARLSVVQLLQFSEILEVLVVCPGFDINGHSHEVVPPFGQCKHDHKQFLVIDLVIPFCDSESL